MPTTKSNGIEICYETFGDASDPAMLLIMGLGAQMIIWPEGFCELLAGRGYHVIRFDNRDVGLSTKIEEGGVPDIGEALSGQGTPAYTLSDMAADAAGLLEALSIDRAHIVGASMGGMIAQVFAIEHPARTLSLTSIMSHPGGTDALPPTPEAMAVLVSERPENREQAQELAARAYKVIGSPGFPFDEQYIRERAGRAFDRCFYPVGFLRQIAAIMASQSRVEALGSVGVPTCVIHGEDDPLVPVENGRLTAKALGEDADLVTIPGMGHDLPEGAWEQIVGAIVRTAERAEAHSGG